MPKTVKQKDAPARDDWRTPSELWGLLDQRFNFTFDCCAQPHNAKCERFTNDFLHEILPREAVCWMNPPFSQAKLMIDRWLDLGLTGVIIYRCDNLETEIWQRMLKRCDWVFFPKKRIQYEGHEGKGAMFASALIGFGVEPYSPIAGRFLKPL